MRWWTGCSISKGVLSEFWTLCFAFLLLVSSVALYDFTTLACYIKDTGHCILYHSSYLPLSRLLNCINIGIRIRLKADVVHPLFVIMRELVSRATSVIQRHNFLRWPLNKFPQNKRNACLSTHMASDCSLVNHGTTERHYPYTITSGHHHQ